MMRQLRMKPGFSIVSILSLALGIGATTTVFSVIYGVLINPYPYRGADRMVQLRIVDPSGRKNFLLLSAPQFTEFQKLDVFDGALATDNWDMASTGDALSEAVRTGQLSVGAFAYLGVPPLIGRTFSAPEPVVVLGYPYCQRHYAGAAGAIGKVLQLDHRDYTIAGVMPPRFRWGNSDVYKPLVMTSDPNRVYMVDARLKEGVSATRAEAAMTPLLEQFARETPEHFYKQFHVQVNHLTGVAAGRLTGVLLLLFAAVGVLLAVGCANVSILFLARGAARRQEFAVRAALGATRKRLVGQLFTESFLLALAGGSAGVALAIGSVRAVVAWLPAGTFPPEAVIAVNLPVLVFSVVIAVATGIVSGVSPALRFSSPQLEEFMRTASYRATAGSGSRRTYDFLVAGQVALTILLLAAAGSAIHSFLAAYRARLGYDPSHVLTLGLSLPDGSYTTYEKRTAFYDAIHKRVAGLRGVKSAAVALFPIPPEAPVRQAIEVMRGVTEKAQAVDLQETTGEYFATLGIPLLSGRIWSDAENKRAAHLVVINEEMAHRFWPNGDGSQAVGQRIRFPGFTAFTTWIVAAKGSNDWLEVIGVVGNTPNRGLRESPAPEAFVPYTLLMGDSLSLVIRAESTPLGMAHALREQIHAVDAGQPVGKIETAEDLLRAAGWAREQFVASLFLVFAIIAVTLAATGLYSVVSYATTLRSREFGIRIALGAQKRHVIRLVLGGAVRTVGWGVAAGLALSMACNGVISHWVSASVYDPLMLGLVSLLLFAATGLAAFVPARRAASCDPIQVLRAE